MSSRLLSMKRSEVVLANAIAKFGAPDVEVSTTDTKIPSSVLPLKKRGRNFDKDELTMHSTRVERRSTTAAAVDGDATKAPLVILAGYMCSSMIYYRNLASLARHSFGTVHAVDWLGWGLSSRPCFVLQDDSVATAEAFFVESLEAWRRAQKGMERMTLAGHSMGGYLAAAYAQRYPQNVERLVLISPVGVLAAPVEDDVEENTAPNGNGDDPPKPPPRRRSLSSRLLLATVSMLYDSGVTFGNVLRSLPESRGRKIFEDYIQKFDGFQTDEEKEALVEYLYQNNNLWGSGEHAVCRLLSARAFAKEPKVLEIPHLKVKSIAFVYGQDDWMDVEGGLEVQKVCDDLRNSDVKDVPEVEVYGVPDAGHMLMLENATSFTSAIAMAVGGNPTLEGSKSLPPSFVHTDHGTAKRFFTKAERQREVSTDKQK